MGGGGNDTLNGDAGADTLLGEGVTHTTAVPTRLNGDADNDPSTAATDADILNGGDGDDSLDGGDGAALTGGIRADIVWSAGRRRTR